MLAPVRIAAPEILPVSLAEAKLHLRIEPESMIEDDLIDGLIRAAVDHLDGWTGILGRCLVEQEWRQDFDAGSACFPLPLGPVLSISAVTAAGAPIDPSRYSFKVDGGGRTSVMIGGAISGAVSVTYIAGYPTIPAAAADGEIPAVPARSTVPDAIKVAIMLLIGNWYRTREAVNVGNIVTEMPLGVSALLAPYRRIGV